MRGPACGRIVAVMHEPHEAFAATRRTFQTAAGELAPERIAACAATARQIAYRRRRGWTAALAHARAVSPWHAERLADEADGARPDDVPTMTKEDVRANFDRIVADPRCALAACEAHLAAVDDRPADDLLVWGDTTVHPHVVRSALAAHAGVLEYQVRVTSCGADIDVRRSDRDRPDLAAVHTDLRRVLARAGLHDPEINLNEVPAVNRTAIGKLRQFVPLADADQGGRNPPPVRVR